MRIFLRQKKNRNEYQELNAFIKWQRTAGSANGKENKRNSWPQQTVTFTFKVTQPKFLYNVLEINSLIFRVVLFLLLSVRFDRALLGSSERVLCKPETRMTIACSTKKCVIELHGNQHMSFV